MTLKDITPYTPVSRLRRPKQHYVPDPDLVMGELDRARSRLGTICRHAEREGPAYPGQYTELLAYLRRLAETIDRSITRLETAEKLIHQD